MAKTLTWGVLSTISTRGDGTTVGSAFGNPNSFADVDGVPYLRLSIGTATTTAADVERLWEVLSAAADSTLRL